MSKRESKNKSAKVSFFHQLKASSQIPKIILVKWHSVRAYTYIKLGRRKKKYILAGKSLCKRSQICDPANMENPSHLFIDHFYTEFGARSRRRTDSIGGIQIHRTEEPSCARTKRSESSRENRSRREILPGRKADSVRCRALYRGSESRSAVVKRSRHDSVAIYRRGNRSLARGKVNRVLTMESRDWRLHFQRRRRIYFRYGESRRTAGYVTDRVFSQLQACR